MTREMTQKDWERALAIERIKLAMVEAIPANSDVLNIISALVQLTAEYVKTLQGRRRK